MNGLVYSLDDDSDSTPIYWMGIAIAAAIVHVIIFFGLSFKYVPPPEVDEPVSVMLDDSFLNMLPDPENPVANKAKLEEPKEVASAALPKPVAAPPAPPPPEAPAAVVEPLPPLPPKPKPAQAAAVKPPPVAPLVEKPPAAPEVAEKRPLNEKDLPALKQMTDTAFDENKNTTKLTPREGYLSDRNSTAADRGPKNLPQGDPYIDKGDTNYVKYLGKRGEGNKPAVNSDVNSGSVKKEGAEESGDGGGKHAADFSKSVRTAELNAPHPKDTALKVETPKEKAPEPQKALPPELPPEPILPPPPPAVAVVPDVQAKLKSKPLEPEPIASENGTVLPPKRVKEVVADTIPLPTKFEPEPPRRPRPAAPVRRPEVTEDRSAPTDPSVLQPTSIDKAIDAQAELDRFEAQLNGVNKTGATYEETVGSGAKQRKGQKGHEGNGKMRPGDDNAVSDVTSINLESSAPELGDPRFAKKFDAKTAYIKSFARRIDAKWKADIQAHLRLNLAPGMVSIKFVLRKDGMLIDVQEAYRDRGVPDENVASARRAVKEAANPTADPFPPALENRDTIEYTFNFLYQ